MDKPLICSTSIESIAQAEEYYQSVLVGDHEVCSAGFTITIRFNLEEIHLFSESIQAGRTPRPESLITRRGGREVRVFSKVRARLLDQIIPTIERPVTSLQAKISRGVQLIGPADGRSGERISVVIAPEGAVWFVRTMWVMTMTEYRNALRARRAPWPPK